MNEFRDVKPLPVLLTKIDAMSHAATMLEEAASQLALVALMNDVFKKVGEEAAARSYPGLKDDGTEAVAALKVLATGIVDKDIQMAAMRAAAKEIRDLVNETKLAEARAAAHGIGQR